MSCVCADVLGAETSRKSLNNVLMQVRCCFVSSFCVVLETILIDRCYLIVCVRVFLGMCTMCMRLCVCSCVKCATIRI